MPPKKKKSGKKKGKSAKESLPESGAQLDELGKDFFFSQIRDLETRIARYQKKCDELQLVDAKVKEEYEQITKDRDEMVAFLQKTLENRNDELADLHDRYQGLQQAKELDRESHEKQMQSVRNELQETKERLQSENTLLTARLSSLDDFKYKKDELMANLERMEKQLVEQKEEHKDELHKLDKKATIDKDRLKKEMVMRVNQVAAEFRKVSNKQMAETTKRTIRENVSVTAQITKMSDKTLELIQENDELKAKNKKQRQQIEILEHNEKEISKQNVSNQKIIRMLTEKSKGQEALLAEFEMREEAVQEMVSELNLLRQQTESQREELENLSKENEQIKEDMETLRLETKDHKKKRQKVEKVLADAASSLQAVLTTQISWDGDPEISDTDLRDNMLENLLVILNSAAAIGIGPNPQSMGKHMDLMRSKSALSEMPGSRRGLRKDSGSNVTTPQSVLPFKSSVTHYQLGDLGLVPRPMQAIPTSMDKAKGLSETTRLGSLRRVLTKSVAVQTVSAPKALFFADQLLSQASLTQQQAIIKDFKQKEQMSKKHISKVF